MPSTSIFRLNNRRMGLLLCVFWAICSAANAQFSQPGQLDTTFSFGRQHSYFTDTLNPAFGEGLDGSLRSVLVQPDGKIIIAGSFRSYNGNPRGNIARLDSTGKTDGTFNPGMGANTTINAMCLQPDGRMLVAGIFENINGINRNRIARLNADGSLDVSFSPTSGANSQILAMALQPDGKVIIAGIFTSFDGISRNRIARINANGSIDLSFAVGQGANQNVRAVVIQPDGKVIIGGDFTSFNSTARNRIARLNADGSLDMTFNPGTGTNESVHVITLQTDGKVLIGGNFTTFNGTARNRLARLNTDGSLDAGYNIGSGFNQLVRAIVVEPNGNALIGGEFTTFNATTQNRLVRLNVAGGADNAFNIGSGVSAGIVYTIALQSGSKAIIGGDFSTFNNSIARSNVRLLPNGNVDATYNANPGTGALGSVSAIALQADGKAIIGGVFSHYNSIPSRSIARLNLDGSIDTTFVVGSGAAGEVSVIAIQPDGKIIIGGKFWSYNGTTCGYITRLNPNGSIDPTFNTGGGFNFWVSALEIQVDGKVIVGGAFTQFNGIQRRYIARLMPNGSLDTSFVSGMGSGDGVFATKVQQDGRILIGGAFSNYAGIPRQAVARLLTNGSLDTTFLSVIGANSAVTALNLQADGKCLVGGVIRLAPQSPRGIIRLNANGSTDSTFDLSASGTAQGNAPGSPVFAIAVQPDGRLIIGGDFRSYNGVIRSHIARLDTNGSLDLTFHPDTGANFAVRAIALQANSRALIGGDFTRLNGWYRSRIARVFAQNCPFPVINGTAADTICIGETKNLSGTPGGVWRISVGSGSIIGSTFIPLVPGAVTVYNDLNGCFSPTVTFFVEPPPQSPTLAVVPEICEGSTASITPSAGGSSYRFYSTNTGGSPLLNGDGVNSFTTPVLSSTTTYYVSSLSAAGCESSSRTAVTIAVNPLPVVQIVQQGNTLVANLSVGSFQWYLDGVAISGANASAFIPLQSGIYTLRVTNAQGCMGASNALNVLMASLDDQQKAQIHWATYPVPFSNELTIEAEQPFSYALLDMRGSVLLSGKTDHPEMAISTAHLASGVYMLRLEVNGQSTFRRVVKQ